MRPRSGKSLKIRNKNNPTKENNLQKITDSNPKLWRPEYAELKENDKIVEQFFDKGPITHFNDTTSFS